MVVFFNLTLPDQHYSPKGLEQFSKVLTEMKTVNKLGLTLPRAMKIGHDINDFHGD